MSGFTLDIKNFVEKAKKNPETVARQVSFELFSAVIKASPVDTGRFRMNWQTAGAVSKICCRSARGATHCSPLAAVILRWVRHSLCGPTSQW